MQTIKKINISALALMCFIIMLTSAKAYALGAAVDNPRSCKTTDKPLNIVYLTPAPPVGDFWKMQKSFVKAVANNLNINLKIKEAKEQGQDQFEMASYFKELINKGEKPDYVIGPYYVGGKYLILRTMEPLEIPYFTINTSIKQKNFRLIGLPREKYKYWLGHMSPDDTSASYQMTFDLLNNHNNATPAMMMAISGNIASTVTRNRNSGLRTAVKQTDIALLPIIHSNWASEYAEKRAYKILRNYPNLNLAWTASSEIAEGLSKALFRRKHRPGADFKIVTMDWSPTAVRLLQKDYIVSSYGGHFMEAGWGLILLNDLAHGYDFIDDFSSHITTQLKPLNKENLALYSDAILNQNWANVDFKQLSKCHNPELKKYKFDIEALLKNKVLSKAKGRK